MSIPATRILIIMALLLILSACSSTGGMHVQGERLWTTTASYNQATNSDTLWPAAEGIADSVGIDVGYDHYLRDRLAMGGKVSLRNYDQVQDDTLALEVQFGFRYHFWEVDIGEKRLGFFGDFYGGIQYAQNPVPEGGSETNFTQDTGIGFELETSENVHWIGGYRIKHLSNGEIFGDENPSQNDRQIFMGLTFRID